MNTAVNFGWPSCAGVVCVCACVWGRRHEYDWMHAKMRLHEKPVQPMHAECTHWYSFWCWTIISSIQHEHSGRACSSSYISSRFSYIRANTVDSLFSSDKGTHTPHLLRWQWTKSFIVGEIAFLYWESTSYRRILLKSRCNQDHNSKPGNLVRRRRSPSSPREETLV